MLVLQSTCQGNRTWLRIVLPHKRFDEHIMMARQTNCHSTTVTTLPRSLYKIRVRLHPGVTFKAIIGSENAPASGYNHYPGYFDQTAIQSQPDQPEGGPTQAPAALCCYSFLAPRSIIPLHETFMCRFWGKNPSLL